MATILRTLNWKFGLPLFIKSLYNYAKSRWTYQSSVYVSVEVWWNFELTTFPRDILLVLYVCTKWSIDVTFCLYHMWTCVEGEIPFIQIGPLIVSEFDSIVAIAAAKVCTIMRNIIMVANNLN